MATKKSNKLKETFEIAMNSNKVSNYTPQQRETKETKMDESVQLKVNTGESSDTSSSSSTLREGHDGSKPILEIVDDGNVKHDMTRYIEKS